MSMSPAQREQIMQTLWPKGATSSKMSVWAILDCARDPKIYLALLASRLEFRCLYSGKLPRELEMVAPQLVELHPGNRLTAQLLDEGWGNAWGVFLKTADPVNLRHHLRKFLKVQDEDGRRLLFRYYDPRVLRVYLPTCTKAELAQLFGPVVSYFSESEGGSSLLQFSPAPAGQLVERRWAESRPEDASA
ncbi:DUF4123 domain-containing protein [Paucibacter sp. B2R-40]|uniref:DUF4123 domain-containing protein n=1 Tax=Paucibacter sp. B2R-40 TaxID=2893554 RepID=UPI0021E45E01|nr:DUF4123 domain-containing protein [Paucibacter sp. B2R-40]MCV2355939.1 DUF4123 domain-containing protein [Paucibacter sp. B2R-40]